jgi:hypothetical protein
MKKTFLIAIVLAIASCSGKLDLDEAGSAAEWMTPLADNMPLAVLSIPGAHDAATFRITTLTSWTQTQELDIAALWNCGVRAFDLRPAYVHGEMGIYHDKYSANIGFMEVMNMLLAALDRHPGETAIVIMRHEEEADGNSPDWPAEMGALLAGIRPRLAAYRHGITLGELRGKILVLSRNEYDGGPMGGYIYGWTSDGRLSAQKGVILREEKGFCATMWVQDYYHPEGPDDKWAQVKTMLIATARSGKPYPLVINHCSGYVGTLPDYRTNAMAINAQAASYIRSTGMCTGIVMMDFAGVERSRGKNVGGATLVRALVENN